MGEVVGVPRSSRNPEFGGVEGSRSPDECEPFRVALRKAKGVSMCTSPTDVDSGGVDCLKAAGFGRGIGGEPLWSAVMTSTS